MNAADAVKRSAVVFYLGTLMTGFLAGFGAYKFVLQSPRADSKHVSGDRASRLTTESNTNRAGGDYATFYSLSLDACRAECIRDTRCRAYTHVLERNTGVYWCSLKTTTPPATNAIGIVSGMKVPSARRDL